MGPMLRVLLVEDDPDTRTLFRVALELSGFHVIEAASGPDGVHMALSQRPDCALVDLGLSGLDGCEVASRVRAGDPDRRIRLVAVTGHASDEDRQRALASGFDLYLVKPIEPAALVRAVRFAG